jgi:hypothetical protein
VQVTATLAGTIVYPPSLSNGQPMLQAIDHRSEELHCHKNSVVPAGMFDFLDSKPFAAASIGAIAATLCFVSGVGGDLGLFTIPPLLMLTYWLIFR